MLTLPSDPCIKCLVFGKSDSGKTTFVYEYASTLLSEYTESICLIIARRSKTERKQFFLSTADNESENNASLFLDRILYKWATDKISLITIAASLHLHQDQNLELLVVEDLLEFVSPSEAAATISLFLNAISVFPTCRLLVTMTPRSEVNIVNFRLAMTHYVNTFNGTKKIGVFPNNIAKATEEIRKCLEDTNE